MPFLVQNISGGFSDIISETINAQNSVSFQIYKSTCNHLEAPGFEAFFIDLSKSTTETITSNTNYGLTINNNKTFIDLNINY